MYFFVFYCYFESVLLALFNSSSSEFRDFLPLGYFLFLKAQAIPKEKVESSLAPTGGNILPFLGRCGGKAGIWIAEKALAICSK